MIVNNYQTMQHILAITDQDISRDVRKFAYETARSDLMDLANRGLMMNRKIGKTWVFTPSVDLVEKLRAKD
ncbi:MAG: hypothetical protein ACHRXM_11135 [Isosphaerales bacterium]